MGGACDIDAHFVDNEIVFDTTFCGDWAASFWQDDANCAPLAACCNDYAAASPGVFSKAYVLLG